jgi:uncharacterized protein (TIGR02001 family)
MSRAHAQAWDFSGNVTATTDYVFRGVSQTMEDPALQAGLKLAHESGFYGSVWGSNVDYGDTLGTDAEVDLVVGYGGKFSDDWGYDLNLTRYTYPGTEDEFDLDYNELIGTVTYKDRFWTTLGWSNDVFASDEAGTYLLAGVRFPITERFRLETIGAHYFLDDDAYDDDYSHAQLNAIYAWERFDVRATYHWTSSSTEDLFGEVGDSRFEVAASLYF